MSRPSKGGTSPPFPTTGMLVRVGLEKEPGETGRLNGSDQDELPAL